MFNNISTTSYTNFNIPFTSPSISNEFYVQLNGVVGNLLARNWAVISGTSVNTQVKGNLNVPYGNITTSDLFYGASASSLTTALSNLSIVANTSPSGLPISTDTQTALNNKLNKADPTYTGMLSNANSNFQVDNTGLVNCFDLKYNSGTSLTTSVSTLNNQRQPKLTNLNNIMNNLTSVNALLPTFTPTDTPSWFLGVGSFTSNSDTITNTWDYTENIAQKLTLTAGTGSNFDLRMNTISVSSYIGQTLVIKVWVKLGSPGGATNFCISVNNSQTWTGAVGKCFTSTDGLNTTTYTQLTFSCSAPANGLINVHIGSHITSGIVNQTAGTVYTYGWQIFVRGKTSVLESDLLVNGNLTTTDLFYGASASSLTTALSKLAPITSGLIITAAGLDANGPLTGGSLQVNGNANIIGDVLYGLGPTSLTNTINGKADLSGASFTGAIATSSNLNVGGSYGAWAMALLSGASYAVGTSGMTWAASTTSYNISHTVNTNSFQVSQAGTYFIGCYITSTSSGSSGVMQLIGRYSTNGTTWSNVLVSTYPGSTLIANSSTVFLQGIYSMAANSYFDVRVYNGTPSALTFHTSAPNSYFYMYRVG